eukprot:TRINITY_DN395_c0_g2_i1.p2 TRINITY_DN395_c0_g2~~TRINITY_DN395_c0_g2_i1.p2  ORF type:complete len:202 (-),score=64.53 TRINITY_DN395_c0_g2_i1:992-1597(-)
MNTHHAVMQHRPAPLPTLGRSASFSVAGARVADATNKPVLYQHHQHYQQPQQLHHQASSMLTPQHTSPPPPSTSPSGYPPRFASPVQAPNPSRASFSHAPATSAFHTPIPRRGSVSQSPTLLCNTTTIPLQQQQQQQHTNLNNDEFDFVDIVAPPPSGFEHLMPPLAQQQPQPQPQQIKLLLESGGSCTTRIRITIAHRHH